MQKLWILGGTTEAREFINKINTTDYEVFVSVATDYGKDILSYLESNQNIHIISKRLTCDDMVDFINTHNFNYVIDATHPHAVIVSSEAKKACEKTQVKYLSLKRNLDKFTDNAFIVTVKSTTQAVDVLKNTSGKIFVATGSKELHKFSELQNYKDRIYARVLPMEASLKACTDLGLKGSHIICMQGPFSKALNTEMLKQCGAEFLITKNSGDVGGLAEKLESAKELSIKVIIIDVENNHDSLCLDEVLEILEGAND